ncbi:MAG TPA: hypothetical protein VF444_09790 [Pseudonocardiaceae bacterium]
MASGDSGGFSVSYSDLQKLIAAVEDQHDRLGATLNKASAKLITPPPANDDYSNMWANQAEAAVKTYMAWNLKRQDDLKALIDKLNESLKNYRQTDTDNAIGS